MEKNKKLWICGKIGVDKYTGHSWELIGVYDLKEKAIKACITNDHFISSVILNKTDNGCTKIFKDCIFPLIEEK